MLYSDAIYEVENVLFFNKTNFHYPADNMYKAKIGLVKGYAYKNINKEKFTNQVYINNEIDAFDMLNRGQIDLLPSNKLVGIYIVKKYFNDFYSNIDFIKDKQFISSDLMYILFNKTPANQKMLKMFNEGLKAIKLNGQYKKIILQNSDVLNTDLSNYVNLVNNTESFPMVVATEEKNSKEKYMIPRGTKAIVLEWSPHFREKSDLKIYDEMFKTTKVKILNGPLRGKILYVENMYIEIN